MYSLKARFRPLLPSLAAALLFALLCLALSCKHSGPIGGGEIMYVSAPEATLRDHVAVIYNRVGSVKNGERVQVLERQKRFVRVRSAEKVEGWVELRALVPSQTYDQFQQLSQENRTTPVEGRGITRTELNMHVAPARDADTLYQLPASAKVEMLKRASSVRATREEIAAKRAAALARLAGEAVKPAPKKHSTTAASRTPSEQAPPASAREQTRANLPGPAAKAASKSSAEPATASAPGDEATPEPPPAPMDDWWLVRDQQGHTGWVLARMVDLDIPLDVAQYAEGQRIQAAFVLNTVQDEQKGAVPQYLVLLNENRDGISYDFNQVRVFTWNLKKHRYETGYREHYIMGYFPVQVSTEDFGREGTMPVFTVRIQNQDGSITPRKYRLIGNVVRQVLAPGEVNPPAAHSPDEPRKLLAGKKPRQGKAGAHQGKKH